MTKDNGTLALTPEIGVQSCEPLEEHRGKDKGISTREHKQSKIEFFENDHRMLTLDKEVKVTQINVSKPH